MLWYVKAYFYEYWHWAFEFYTVLYLVLGYFSFIMASLFTYWTITDWFFREGFIDAFNRETIYWFESNNNFIEGMDERILEATLQDRVK